MRPRIRRLKTLFCQSNPIYPAFSVINDGKKIVRFASKIEQPQTNSKPSKRDKTYTSGPPRHSENQPQKSGQPTYQETHRAQPCKVRLTNWLVRRRNVTEYEAQTRKKMVPGRIDFLEKDAMSLYTNIVCLSRFSSSSQKSRGGHRPLGRTSRHTDHPKKWDDLTPSRSATFTSTYLQPRRKKKLIKNR